METQSNGDSDAKVHRVIEALESTKDVYVQELLRLRALNEAIPTKQCLQMMKGSQDGNMELPSCPALLQNLLREREILIEELQQQKVRCEELLRQLEQEHVEKLEVQMGLNVLSETVRAALQGEKVLVERNWHLVLDQQVLTSKLDEVSKTRLPALQAKIKDLEVARNSLKQEELILFCHAMLWCLLKTLKETYSFAPT